MKKTTNFLIRFIFLALIFAIVITSCKKRTDEELITIKSTINTLDVSHIDVTTAICVGKITDNGGAEISERGICWSTGLIPAITDQKAVSVSASDSFTCQLFGLSPNTKYYASAYAINKEGVAYGNQVCFTTLRGAVDIDSNIYHSVIIGEQEWMVENLKTTKYNDGTPIPLITDGNAWIKLTTPGYCWYNNEEAKYKNPYGAYYNWYAVGTGKLCPAGWHVSSLADAVYLYQILGGLATAGALVKEAGTAHWTTPNAGATNVTGFTALPGGFRELNNGNFTFLGNGLYLWTSTEANNQESSGVYMNYNATYIYPDNFSRAYGFNVRCIKSSEIPREGLIAWYPLNGNAKDSSGNNNNGTVYGPVPIADKNGVSARAMFFDGVDDFISLPANSKVGPDLTISAWVKVIVTKNWARVIEFGNGPSNNNVGLALSGLNASVPAFINYNVGTAENVNYGASYGLSLNRWFHLAVTVSGKTVTLYYNGMLASSYTTTLTPMSVERSINYIGRSNWVADGYASAVFDNIRIYNRALRESEIRILANE